jgi:uncharacterized protein YbjT (DUF2867 family)
MSKLLVVFGATGRQGGSVIDSVLTDAELSQQYRVRAIVRDVNSDKAKQLKEKVEVVSGDAQDRPSLEAALVGAHTIFAMTAPSLSATDVEMEYKMGKMIADVAVEKGAEYIIFSTLPSIKDISGGKYNMAPFDDKAKAEQYIRSLPIKSAFYSPGSFMDNFEALPWSGPQKSPDGNWVIARHFSSQTLMPMIDAGRDSGKFVGAILADPDKFEGRTLCGTEALYSLDEIAAIVAKVTGKTVVFKQVSAEEFKKGIPYAADLFFQLFGYWGDFGYYGPKTKEQVTWSASKARGKLTTFEGYLRSHPPQLE